MTARARLGHLRPLSVAYVWTIATALIATGSTGIHPTLGRLWDVIATAGALAIASTPFVHNARARAGATGLATFVIIIHAEEWIRLSEGTPVGFSIAALWVAALIGLIAEVSADQDLRLGAKLDPPAPLE